MNRVLIVEDDLTIARIYQGLIRLEGCEPVVASDGELAIKALGERRPDLVLLDLMLPKINGVQVLKHIRSTAGLKEIPVVVFTNACMGTLVQEAMDAGATQCLIKAQTAPKQLMQALRVFLKPALPATVSSPTHPGATVKSGLENSATPKAFEPAPFTAGPIPTAQLSPFISAPESLMSTTHSSTPPAPSEQEPELPRLPGSAIDFIEETTATEQSEVRQQLVEKTPGMLKALRNELQLLAKKEDEKIRRAQLGDLCRSLHALTVSAGLASLRAVAQMSSALEGLFGELHRSVDKLNPSTLRTTAQGVDCLDGLFASAAEKQRETTKTPLILVLDDDAICRKLIGSALTRADLRALRLEDPGLALNVLNENPFDLVFLDVMMPGMDGFELCKKIRASEMNKTTPVVFVTSLSTLDTRALSILSGGNDFIGKPFVPAELIVKALVHVLSPQRREATRSAGTMRSHAEATKPSFPSPLTVAA